mgnify:FL=1
MGPVSRKSRKLLRPEKPSLKLRHAYSVKLVFSYFVKGVKFKITEKFRALKGLRFEDTKRILSSEMVPKSLRIFEKRATKGTKGSYKQRSVHIGLFRTIFPEV